MSRSPQHRAPRLLKILSPEEAQRVPIKVYTDDGEPIGYPPRTVRQLTWSLRHPATYVMMGAAFVPGPSVWCLLHRLPHYPQLLRAIGL